MHFDIFEEKITTISCYIVHVRQTLINFWTYLRRMGRPPSIGVLK